MCYGDVSDVCAVLDDAVHSYVAYETACRFECAARAHDVSDMNAALHIERGHCKSCNTSDTCDRFSVVVDIKTARDVVEGCADSSIRDDTEESILVDHVGCDVDFSLDSEVFDLTIGYTEHTPVVIGAVCVEVFYRVTLTVKVADVSVFGGCNSARGKLTDIRKAAVFKVDVVYKHCVCTRITL